MSRRLTSHRRPPTESDRHRLPSGGVLAKEFSESLRAHAEIVGEKIEFLGYFDVEGHAPAFAIHSWQGWIFLRPCCQTV